MTPGPWYANVNDLIGGWCVGSEKGLPSENMKAADVADMVRTEEDADMIASCSVFFPALQELRALYDLFGWDPKLVPVVRKILEEVSSNMSKEL